MHPKSDIENEPKSGQVLQSQGAGEKLKYVDPPSPNLWRVLGDRAFLRVYFDGHEYVIARSARDALDVWAEHSGCKAKEHVSSNDDQCNFVRVADDEVISVRLSLDGDIFETGKSDKKAPTASMTAECWALLVGRGWLCQESP